MDVVDIDDLNLGSMNHGIKFSEEDMKALQNQLDAPISPQTTAELAPINLGSFEMEDKSSHPDSILESVEVTEQLSTDINTVSTGSQISNGGLADLSSSQSSDPMPITHSIDINSIGLKADSGDPPLFSTVSNYDNPFTVNDTPMQQIEIRLSPHQNTTTTFANLFHQSHHQVETQYHQSPHGPYTQSSVPDAAFGVHHNSAIADHPMVAEHMFANGRRRSQSVPPGLEAGMSFQRRFISGNAVGISKPISATLETQMGLSGRQVRRGGGWRHHPYIWPENTRGICGRRDPIRHQIDGVGIYYPQNRIRQYRDSNSAPISAPGSPILVHHGYMNSPSPPMQKQNGIMNNGKEKRKGKKQKVPWKGDVPTGSTAYLDKIFLCLEGAERTIRESVEEIKRKGGCGNDKLEQ
jgi:hypothetical protein